MGGSDDEEADKLAQEALARAKRIALAKERMYGKPKGSSDKEGESGDDGDDSDDDDEAGRGAKEPDEPEPPPEPEAPLEGDPSKGKGVRFGAEPVSKQAQRRLRRAERRKRKRDKWKERRKRQRRNSGEPSGDGSASPTVSATAGSASGSDSSGNRSASSSADTWSESDSESDWSDITSGSGGGGSDGGGDNSSPPRQRAAPASPSADRLGTDGWEQERLRMDTTTTLQPQVADKLKLDLHPVFVHRRREQKSHAAKVRARNAKLRRQAFITKSKCGAIGTLASPTHKACTSVKKKPPHANSSLCLQILGRSRKHLPPVTNCVNLRG